jgi:hypothetical protein
MKTLSNLAKNSASTTLLNLSTITLPSSSVSTPTSTTRLLISLGKWPWKSKSATRSLSAASTTGRMSTLAKMLKSSLSASSPAKKQSLSGS